MSRSCARRSRVGPEPDQRAGAFVRRFVRPRGLDHPATSYVADAFEAAAASKPGAPEPRPPAARFALLIATAIARLSPRRLLKELRKLVLNPHRRARALRGLRDRVAVRGRRKPLVDVVAPGRQPSRRVLFVLNYPGYLRYFDGTIAELAERGYEVLLAFDRPEMQKEGLEGIAGLGDRVRVVERTPRRTDIWGAVARGLRVSGDYARYLQPGFRDAYYLRERRRKGLTLPHAWRFLARLPVLPGGLADVLLRVLMLLERAVPSSAAVEEFIAGHDPDAVIVTPLVSEASPQTDVVKSSRALGLPVAVCVASWDHLTTKGMMRIVPDRVLVWNGTQAAEARDLHRVPAARITLTGAQPFDRWFERRPSTSRPEFCAKVGLPDEHPYVLFVGSTSGISKPDDEYLFVRRWIQTIRDSGDPRLSEVGILIRPHPYNPGGWADADLSGLGPVAVWPRGRANPVNDDDRAEYFDSMYHAAAVVGINTSAMIETAIVGRPVHTIRTSSSPTPNRARFTSSTCCPRTAGFSGWRPRSTRTPSSSPTAWPSPSVPRPSCRASSSTSSVRSVSSGRASRSWPTSSSASWAQGVMRPRPFPCGCCHSPGSSLPSDCAVVTPVPGDSAATSTGRRRERASGSMPRPTSSMTWASAGSHFDTPATACSGPGGCWIAGSVSAGLGAATERGRPMTHSSSPPTTKPG